MNQTSAVTTNKDLHLCKTINKINLFEQPSYRSLDDIAEDINLRMNTITNSFIEIGILLIEAKQQLTKHGEWGKWLEDNVPIGSREAERYMAVAKSYSNPTLVSNLGITKALAILSVPKTERDDFIAVPHEINGEKKYVQNMSVRELKEIIRVQKGLPLNENDTQKFRPMRRNITREDYLKDIETVKISIGNIQRYIGKHAKENGNKADFEYMYSLKEAIDKCVQLISLQSQDDQEENIPLVDEN